MSQQQAKIMIDELLMMGVDVYLTEEGWKYIFGEELEGATGEESA